MKLLDTVKSPADIKKMRVSELNKLAAEIREELIEDVSKTGGHLAPSLGVVELTLALHYIFNSPEDKLVWDVGHQSYVHKMITGRREQFATLRQMGGMSGFPKRKESPHDAFDTGHSSTSISAALGMALARDLSQKDNEVVAIIGDGALTGGMAFEALNHAGHLGTNLIVVLNDNEMSIVENVGALSGYLSRMRTDPKYYRGKEEIENILKRIPTIGNVVYKAVERIKDSFKYLMVPGMLFEELGFTYLGPVDGHSISDMIEVFNHAKKVDEPVLVHVVTKKGKGYEPAEENPDKFHGVGPFDIKTGETSKSKSVSYTEVFGQTLCELAAEDNKILAITAAMPAGTGLNYFADKFPERYFDVGIAEQHAVTMAAGMACAGFKPVVAIYSTFFQRAYDQILHDVANQNLPVILGIDRAGLVGEDGSTHQGLFDLSFLRHIPNMVIMAPKDENELRAMMKTAVNYNGPVAIRYPRGAGEGVQLDKDYEALPVGKAEVLKEGKDITIMAIGNTVHNSMKAADKLAEEGIEAGVINCRFVKPLDEETIIKYAQKSEKLLTVEENVLMGGFGSAIIELLESRDINVPVHRLGIPDEFVRHGAVSLLREKYGLTPDGIAEVARQEVENKKSKKTLKSRSLNG